MRPRDLIVSVFLEQGRPLDAAQVSVLVGERLPGKSPAVGRATIYRALRWMVDVGVAKKVDGSGGRALYAQAHRRLPQIAIDPSRTANAVAFRDGLRLLLATCTAAHDFFAAAAIATSDSRVRATLRRLADDARARLVEIEARRHALARAHQDLESQPTLCFYHGAPTALYAAGAQEATAAPDGRALLMVAIRCARRSHRFFSGEAERAEEPASRAAFQDFAECEQAHLDALLHDYRLLSDRRPKRLESGQVPAPRAARRAGARS